MRAVAFALLPGAGNHYGWEPQLADGAPAIKFLPPLYEEQGRQLKLDELPQPFYSSDVFADKLIGYLDDRPREQPFFAYLPFTAPHWPLQADPAAVAKYQGWYDDGPDALRLRRLEALKKAGLIPADVDAHPLVHSYKTSAWHDMSDDERRYSARTMETYAAMVEGMDSAIGRVITYLEAQGELDNTFVLFMSDNGAEGALLEAIPVMGPALSDVIAKYYDNSYKNIGRKNSFTWYGPQWAQAGTAPSRMYKAWVTEGGIRCPAIVRYPPLTRSFTAGGPAKVADAFVTVMDILSTVLELAATPHPGKTFRGRPVLPPRGASWVSYLGGNSPHVHTDTYVVGWELFGQHAIRQGRWKAVFVPAPAGPETWQLYDVHADPGETKDLAQDPEHKTTLDKLLKYWGEYVAETGTVLADPKKITGYRGQ